MEKVSNSKSTKLSKMLQRALSIGHSAAPFSPAREFRHNRTTSTANRGFFFSSPMTPLVPTAARVKRSAKYDVVLAEPTSPKISCIGQIKLAKHKIPEKNNKAIKNLKTASSLFSLTKEGGKGSFSKLKRLFSTGRNQSRKSNSTASEQPAVAVEAVAASSVGKMKKFASSRDAIGSFDWTAVMKQKESQSDHSYDEDLTIPYSVRVPLAQLEGLSLCPKPKNEINLWKRRTIDPPKPLQVKAT